MKELVDKEKLKKVIRDQIIAETEWDADATEIPFGDIKKYMKKCTLSPAELTPSDEDRRKARAWDEFEDFFISRKKLFTEEEEHSVKQILELMRDLLTQSKEEKR